MSDDNTQGGAEPSPASAGSVSIGEAQDMGSDEWFCPWYRCPRCEKVSIARSFRYCPNCGVQLQWQV
jgi:hypothetical protein